MKSLQKKQSREYHSFYKLILFFNRSRLVKIGWLLALGIVANACQNDFKTRVKEANDALNAANANPDLFISYNANGATGGTVPVDASPYKAGQSATVLGNTGNLTRTGFAFTGWNTKADGSGAGYNTGATFTVSVNTTLFAIWQEDAVPPVVGTQIQFTSIKSDSMTISWGEASDAVSASSNLQYRLVKATSSSAIDSIEEVDAISGNDLLQEYTAASLNFNSSNLTPDTDYYFAVVVRDEAGQKTLYTPQLQATPIAQWSYQAYLKPTNVGPFETFGGSVSIDGDTIVVGSNLEASNTTTIIHGTNLSGTNNSGSANGAAYVFKRTGTTWVQEAYLKAPNNTNGDQFGISVAISGDTIVVGADRETSRSTEIVGASADFSGTNNSGNSNGAAYVYRRSGSTWSFEAYLKAPNNSDSDQFAGAVAIDNDTIIARAWETSTTNTIINGNNLTATNNSGNGNGAVYVFQRNGTTWTHEAYLKAPNNSDSDYFGAGIDIDSNTIVVGATSEDSSTTNIINDSNLAGANNLGNSNGAAYVFVRSGSAWSLQSYLKAANGESFDDFGSAVAIDGDTIAVGARHENGTTAIINGSNLSSANNSGSLNGAVYVFSRSGTDWTLQSYLKAPNTGSNDKFGDAVAIDGNTIAVGAWQENSTTSSIINKGTLSGGDFNNSGTGIGAVYVFRRIGTQWQHESYLKSPDPAPSTGDNLGKTVSISGNTIIAGIPGEDSNISNIIGPSFSSANNDAANAGAAHVFVRE